MRILKSDDIEIRVRASNLARLFFQQEFGFGLEEELAPIIDKKMQTAKLLLAKMSQEELEKIIILDGIQDMPHDQIAETLKDNEILDDQKLINSFIDIAMTEVTIPAISGLRLIWAMNKAQLYAENNKAFPDFETWLTEYDDFNINGCMAELLEEINVGFFR